MKWHAAARSLVLSLFRIVTGLLFWCHGLQSVFGWFGGTDGHGGTLSPTDGLSGFAGTIELVTGALIVLGLLTRLAALVASGAMAFAYFDVHLPHGFWPIVDHGEPAVLYCWIFFLLIFTGPGVVSLDRILLRGRLSVSE